MDFSVVGFGVRKWPWSGPFGAHPDDWEQNESRYSELVSIFGVWQNEYQALVINSAQLADIAELINSWPDCNLLAIEYPADMVRLRDSRLGLHTADASFDLTGFVCCGLDVCDFNGLYSVLGHPKIQTKRGSSNLFSPKELWQALELVQYANVLDPSHAPFAVARLWSLKPV